MQAIPMTLRGAEKLREELDFLKSVRRVIFGATVTVLNLDSDEEQTYRIVGDDEADFKQNLISVNSPIARGLIGKEVDDVVVIKTPGGEVEFEVIKVEYL